MEDCDHSDDAGVRCVAGKETMLNLSDCIHINTFQVVLLEKSAL